MKNTSQIVFTPTIDTNAYAVGDVYFDTIEVPIASEFSGQRCVIHSISVIESTDLKVGFTLHFFDRLVTLGVVNDPPTITDADALSYQSTIEINQGDYYDIGGVAVAFKNYQGSFYKTLPPNSTSLFVGGIINGIATYGVTNPITIKLGVLWL